MHLTSIPKRKQENQIIPRSSFYPHAVDGWYIFETTWSVSHILKMLIIYSQHWMEIEMTKMADPPPSWRSLCSHAGQEIRSGRKVKPSRLAPSVYRQRNWGFRGGPLLSPGLIWCGGNLHWYLMHKCRFISVLTRTLWAEWSRHFPS